MASVEMNTTADGTKQTTPLIADTQQNKAKRKRQGIAVIVIVVVTLIIVITLVVVYTGADDASSTKPNVLYVYHEQSRIYTMDHESQDMDTNTAVEAMCIDVSAQKFISVGNATEVFAECMSTDYATMKQIHFNGSLAENITILPGLTDSHAHIMSYGANFFRVDLSAATSIEEVITATTTFIANNSDAINDMWVTGWGWDQELFTDQSQFIDGLPTRWMLDQAFPEYKLFFRRIDGHSSWVNTAALSAIPGGLPDEDPDGGKIIRMENGTATGALIDDAMDYVTSLIPDWTEAERFEMLELVLNECAANGLTGVHDAGESPSVIELFKAVIDDPEAHGFHFTMRVNAFASHNSIPEAYAHLKGDLYKGLLTVDTVKFMMDGALGSRGAALIEPYCDVNGSNGTGNHGILMYTPETFYNNISRWHEADYQIATHAIGDAGNRLVIDGYIDLINNFGLLDEDHRLRIEHAQIVNATYDIPRVGQYHIIPSMQPTHATSDMVFAEDRLCAYRLTGAYAWQRMLNFSVPALPFGSDFPAVGVVNPFLGIFAAITREDESGSPEGGWTPYNKVSRYQAVKGYTYDAAYAAFQEDVLGTVSEDKFADFIVVDRDIFEVDEMSILDTNVIATYLSGDPVYIDPEWEGIINF